MFVFCRSFLDELKACVTSDDIEGIVCLTAVMHIIFIIHKGWLNFSYIVWAVVGCISELLSSVWEFSSPVWWVPFSDTCCLLGSFYSPDPVPADILAGPCFLTQFLSLSPFPTGPATYPSLCLRIEFLLICHVLPMFKNRNIFLLMMVCFGVDI